MIELLASACAKAGSQLAWADKHDLSPAYISDVLKGRRSPGRAIANALGLERVADYQPKLGTRRP